MAHLVNGADRAADRFLTRGVRIGG